MTPIGRGQRQLIIGDRKTGKTAVASTRSSTSGRTGRPATRSKQVRCIYVAIGQKGSTIACGARRPRGGRRDGVHHHRRRPRPPTRAGFKYLAPYTGSAIGQHWMYDGKHVLIVFDDLTKQAEAYRADLAAAAPPAGPRGVPR